MLYTVVVLASTDQPSWPRNCNDIIVASRKTTCTKKQLHEFCMTFTLWRPAECYWCMKVGHVSNDAARSCSSWKQHKSTIINGCQGRRGGSPSALLSVIPASRRSVSHGLNVVAVRPYLTTSDRTCSSNVEFATRMYSSIEKVIAYRYRICVNPPLDACNLIQVNVGGACI